MLPRVVLLFGAGASYGSGSIWRKPPLGRDLLDSLTGEYPDTWGQLPLKLRREFEDVEREIDFERGMGYLYESQLRHEITNLADLLKDMGCYFSQFRIDRPANNQYFKLISRYKDRMLSGEVLMATLNYDCLIEYAASVAGVGVTYWGDIRGARLLKLHGSCNFILKGISGQGKVIMSSGTFVGPMTAIDPSVVPRELRNIPIPPAMSLFNVEKTDLICPDRILEFRKEYKESVLQADLVVSIGVYPRLTGDSHVWDPLKSTSGRLGLVDREEFVDRWITSYREGKDDIRLPSKFIDALSGICQSMDAVL